MIIFKIIIDTLLAYKYISREGQTITENGTLISENVSDIGNTTTDLLALTKLWNYNILL